MTFHQQRGGGGTDRSVPLEKNLKNGILLIGLILSRQFFSENTLLLIRL